MTTTDKERPRIGEFTRPSDPRAKEAKSETEQEVEQKEAEGTAPPASDTEKAAKARLSLYEEMQNGLKPITDYKAYLKELEIDEGEAARIVDELLSKGYYQESFEISKKLSVMFRTREQRDTVRLQMAVQVQRPLYTDAMDELMTRYNMAASLAAYGRETFKFPAEKSTDDDASKGFDERLAFVERLSTPIFSRLSVALARFDRKISAVMREGVAENF